MHAKTNFEHALDLAQKQIPCFPCRDNKSPKTARGFKDASCDERKIERWWGQWPDALIGTPTGLLFDVLDLDLQHAEARDWAANTRLPATRTHHTRSGGRHLLFKPTPGLTNSTSKLAPHVDIRAGGGYIIWWPAEGFDVEHPHKIAAMPAWIVEALKPKREPEETAPLAGDNAFTRYGAADTSISAAVTENRIDGLIATVATAPEGERSSRLYWASRRFVEMVDAGEVDEDYARDLLLQAALYAGHPKHRSDSTIDSAFKNRGGAS